MLIEILLIILWKLLLILIAILMFIALGWREAVKKKPETKPELETKDEFFAFRKLFSEKTMGGIGK